MVYLRPGPLSTPPKTLPDPVQTIRPGKLTVGEGPRDGPVGCPRTRVMSEVTVGHTKRNRLIQGSLDSLEIWGVT